MYAKILEDLKKDPASHGNPLDILLLCRLREQVLKELGFKDIFKKVKVSSNKKLWLCVLNANTSKLKYRRIVCVYLIIGLK
ncbi:pantothenate kinase [Trifolium repens]|nr:pantothenate kinase [Trifolium repens]